VRVELSAASSRKLKVFSRPALARQPAASDPQTHARAGIPRLALSQAGL
jgi:hypothetical protein